MLLELCDQILVIEIAFARPGPDLITPAAYLTLAGFVFALVTMPIVYFLVEDDDLKLKASVVYDFIALAGIVFGGLLVASWVVVVAMEYGGFVLGGGAWSGPGSYRNFNARSALGLGLLVIGPVVGFVSSKIRPPNRLGNPFRRRTPIETSPDGLTKLNLLNGEPKAGSDPAGSNVDNKDGSVE